MVFFDPAYVTSVVAAAAMLGLAAWLLFLDLGNRVHQAFALVLFFRAGFTGILAFHESGADFAARIRFYFTIANVAATLFLGYAFWRRYRRDRTRPLHWGLRSLPWILLAGGLASEYAYFADHSLRDTTLAPAVAYTMVTYAVVALAFASFLRTGGSDARDRCYFLASLAFILEPIFYASIRVTNVLYFVMWGTPEERDFLGLAATQIALITNLVTLGFAVATVVMQTRWLRRTSRAPSAVPVLLGWIGLAATTGVVAAFLFYTTSTPQFVMRGVWALAFPALIGYALARHRFLMADRTAKLTIQRGTLVAVFVTTFYLISEGTQEMLTSAAAGRFEAAAPFLGVVGAGLIVFLLHPLQRAAERLASRTVPPASTLPELTEPERLALYREHCELAWMDGQLQRKERVLLDALRSRLGIASADAARAESEVVQRLVTGSQSRRALVTSL